MKTMHLVCNAHLDPVWQWDWEEGATACLATFYAAVKLAEKYDYIFCHNEVVLYEYIEKYDPELFKKIQELVKQGKWHIMGGWYVQPDCEVPSGESFIRSITLGREYFMEKFASRPTTAINFDAFAHSRGLPQILRKTGYDSYIICRPMPWYEEGYKYKFPLPKVPFWWKGIDGSEVKVMRVDDLHIYCSELGKAKEAILRKMSHLDPNEEQNLILWGVGNHGGGASANDLEQILMLMDEKKGEMKIIHSTPEAYFNSIDPTAKYDKEFVTFRKSYSSYSLIKQKHDELENALYTAEKAVTACELALRNTYDKEVFKNAERVLAQVAFHDVLSGTAIKTGTESSVRKIETAIENVKEQFFKAFQSMAKSYKATKEGDYSFVIFNHQPYEYETFVESEFLALDAKEKYITTLYDEEGNELPHQIIKEESEIDMARRLRFLYKVKLPALGTRKISVHLTPTTGWRFEKDESNEDIVIQDTVKTVKISRKTGLIESLIINNKECAYKGLMQPVMFDDNEDPWGWNKLDVGFGNHDMKLDNSSSGLFKGAKAVQIVENGDVMTQVQALFKRGESRVVIDYKIYKDTPYIDTKVRVIWNDKNKGLRLKLPLNGSSKYFAQAAYGTEFYSNDGNENPQNRFVGVMNDKDAFTIYNNSGVHSSNKKGKNLYMLLLNGSCYCAHPTGPLGKNILPREDVFTPNIELGYHLFNFRLGVNKFEECDRLAQEFNHQPYVVEYYPHGDGNTIKETVTVSNPNVVITALKKRKYGGYLFRVYNSNSKPASTVVSILGNKKTIKLKKYEFKTYEFDGNKIEESIDSSVY